VLAANHAASAILAALIRRLRTGHGAHLDVSMLEALISADSLTFASVLNGGELHGNPRPGMVVHEIGGRYIAFQIVGAPRLWERLLGLMQRPELAADPRFATAMGRRRHWPALRAVLVEWLAGFTSSDAALDALGRARIPCAPVLHPAEVIASPHLAERGFFPSLAHPARGEVRVTASPYHLDGRPVSPSRRAPYRIGEHTRAVLTELLGYAPDRIDALRDAGVIETP
jgi:crotonobetainyl-CoA:carnitine CoA-transferase CaiB-like acyl-CoA transferase